MPQNSVAFGSLPFYPMRPNAAQQHQPAQQFQPSFMGNPAVLTGSNVDMVKQYELMANHHPNHPMNVLTARVSQQSQLPSAIPQQQLQQPVLGGVAPSPQQQLNATPLNGSFVQGTHPIIQRLPNMTPDELRTTFARIKTKMSEIYNHQARLSTTSLGGGNERETMQKGKQLAEQFQILRVILSKVELEITKRRDSGQLPSGILSLVFCFSLLLHAIVLT
jgi:hypothetical protein